jgi:hypothetical protein
LLADFGRITYGGAAAPDRRVFGIGAVQIKPGHVPPPAKKQSVRIATPIRARHSVELLKEKYGGYQDSVRPAPVVPARMVIAVEGQR